MKHGSSVTVIIGSGLSQGLGLPGTTQLTDVVRAAGAQITDSVQVMQRRIDPVTTSEAMWRMATSYYARPNFETMLHLAETALGFTQVSGWLSADDRAKPAWGAFMNIMPQWQRVVEGESLYNMQQFVSSSLASIATSLVRAADDLSAGQLREVRAFFERLVQSHRVTIGTLNYDDVLERALNVWRDGFVDDGDRCAFKPSELIVDGDVPLLTHLHGSVRFAVRRDNGGTTMDISRASDGNAAGQAGGRDTGVRFAQSGEPIVIGPMISGLRKTDKITVPPFGYYQWRLHDALMRSNKLLVIGYGGYDTYITGLINEMQRIHGASLRVGFVVKRVPGTLPMNDWGPLMPGPFLGERVDAHAWLAKLDRVVGTGSLLGDAVCKVYADGFPVSNDAMDDLVDHFE